MRVLSVLIMLVFTSILGPGCYILKDTPDFVEIDDTVDGGVTGTDGNTVKMRVLGTISHSGIADFVVDGETLYVLGDDLGVYNVSNPTDPQLLSGNDNDIKWGKCMALDGGQIYVLHDTVPEFTEYTQLLVFDTATPDVDPTPIMEYTFNSRDYDDLTIHNGCAYMMKVGSGLAIYQLDELMTPVGSPNEAGTKTLDYTIAKNFLYLAWIGTDYVEAHGVSAYKILPDQTFEYVANLGIDVEVATMGSDASHLAIAEAQALSVYAIQSSGELVELTEEGAIDWDEYTSTNSPISHVFFDDDVLYVNAGYSLLIFDLSDDSYTFVGEAPVQSAGPVRLSSNAADEYIYFGHKSEINIVDRR